MTTIFVFILFTTLAGYCIFLLWNANTWRRLPDDTKLQTLAPKSLSVVIPFRNEAENLPHLLQSITWLKAGNNQVNYIFSDDHSTDTSNEIIRRFITKHPEIEVHLILAESTGKKAALQAAIEHSNNEWILTTDADCSFEPQWIIRMLAKQAENGACMVSGPVTYATAPHWQNAFQQTEFAGLIATGAATLYNGIPTMCNGANLLFSKQVWLEQGGYSANSRIAGGDDEFLMQQLHSTKPGSVVFCKDRGALVSTASSPAFRDFLRQRIRWTSKEKHHPYHVQIIRWGTALFYLSIVTGLMLIAYKPFLMSLMVSLALLLKSFTEWHFFKTILPFFNLKVRYSDILRWQGIQLGYPILVGLGLWRKRFTWKEREHYF